MGIATIKKTIHELRILGIHLELERRTHQAESENLTHLEFLKLLLEDEKLCGKSLVAKRLLSRAKFRPSAELVDFNMSYDRGI